MKTRCHEGWGFAGRLGTRAYCDSPLSLVEGTFAWASQQQEFDAILWTGDNARHDNYAKIPRNLSEILSENAKVAQLIATYFSGVRSLGFLNKDITDFLPKVPVLPSIGNNDVFPHDELFAPPNDVLAGLAAAWDPVLTPSMKTSLLNGGYLTREVGQTNLILVGLSTPYLTWGRYECDGSGNNPADEQMQSLNKTLASAAAVIISGHVPPTLWKTSCRQAYAKISVLHSKTIRQHVYGHLHSDQFFLMDESGKVVVDCDASKSYVAMAAAPSIVPSFNPSLRVWIYNTSSLDVVDYLQFYNSISSINQKGNVTLTLEYQLSQAYEMGPGPLTSQYWCALSSKILDTPSLNLKYDQYVFVSTLKAHIDLVCNDPQQAWRCPPPKLKKVKIA